MRLMTRPRHPGLALLLLGGLCLLAPALASAQSNPDVPAAPAQVAGGVPLPLGASSGVAIIQFDATVSDPDFDAVNLEVEIQLVGDPFTNTATAFGPPVASGSATFVFSPPLAEGAYHWQIRAVDATAATSAFVSFGGNAETDADFIIDLTPRPPRSSPRRALGRQLPTPPRPWSGPRRPIPTSSAPMA